MTKEEALKNAMFSSDLKFIANYYGYVFKAMDYYAESLTAQKDDLARDLTNEVVKRDKELDRLKDMIKELWWDGKSGNNVQNNRSWENFKKENNL